MQPPSKVRMIDGIDRGTPRRDTTGMAPLPLDSIRLAEKLRGRRSRLSPVLPVATGAVSNAESSGDEREGVLDAQIS